MLWYCFWMLHGSLEVINNCLSFAYVNMHSTCSGDVRGTGWSEAVPVGNVCSARSCWWLNSYPDAVLGFRFSVKQVQQLHPECIWCLTLHQVPFHLSKSSLFFMKMGRKLSAHTTFYKRVTLHSQPPFWVCKAFMLPVAVVSDSNEICDQEPNFNFW